MQEKQLNHSDSNEPAFFIHNGREIILLGENDFIYDPDNIDTIRQKLAGEISEEIAGLWGYVGYSNQSVIDWSGTIRYSGTGNDFSKGTVLDLVTEIHENHPSLEEKNLKVVERFISFDDVNFPLPELSPDFSDLPCLELVLFLDSRKGTLALQQLYGEDETDLSNGSHDGEDWEPILPEATPDHSFDRDRLHYIFEIDYPFALEEDEHGQPVFGSFIDDRFVIKLLTYERETTAHNSAGFIDSMKDRLLKVEERYRVLIYDKALGWFRNAESGDIDTDLKTLLLLHGTFKSTDKSFANLRTHQWIEKEILSKGKYGQVIAFDHASVFDDIPSNVDHLMTMLGDLIDEPFKHKVNWIGTSRGALLGKHLTNLFHPGGVNPLLPMGDGVMVAGPGGGARIIDFIGSVRRALTILKLVLTPTGVGKVFIELVQHSAKFMTKQPGIREQKINSPELKKIIDFPTPHVRNEILPIVGDFMSAKKMGKKIIGRVFWKISDWVMRKKMGKHHDFVIRCREQFDPTPYQLPTGLINEVTGSSYKKGKYAAHMINSIHGSLLEESKVRKQISNYLNQLPVKR